jgi:hypothetical protein
MSSYRCTPQGCQADSQGAYLSPDCNNECGGDPLYQIFADDPTTALALPRSEQVAVIKHLTAFQSSTGETLGVEVSEADAPFVLEALALDDFRTLVKLPILYPWLRQAIVRDDYLQLLQELATTEALVELLELGEKPTATAFRAVLRRGDKEATKFLLETELMTPDFRLEPELYEAVLENAEYGPWLLFEEPAWFLALPETIKTLTSDPKYMPYLEALVKEGFLSNEAVDVAGFSGNQQAVELLMSKGSRPPRLLPTALGGHRQTTAFALRYYEPQSETELNFLVVRLAQHEELLSGLLARAPAYRVRNWIVRDLAVRKRIPALVARFSPEALQSALQIHLFHPATRDFLLQHVETDALLTFQFRPSDIVRLRHERQQ